MAFYGVGLDVKVRELNLQFIFNRMDFNGNKRLDAGEFE
jgi:hypothetical protein